MSEHGSYQAASAAPPAYSFGLPRRSASEQLAGGAGAPPPPQVFQPLPAPTGKPPFRLDLASVIGANAAHAIEQAGTLVFHAVGDTGGGRTQQPPERAGSWV